jgi:hypothetical protein
VVVLVIESSNLLVEPNFRSIPPTVLKLIHGNQNLTYRHTTDHQLQRHERVECITHLFSTTVKSKDTNYHMNPGELNWQNIPSDVAKKNMFIFVYNILCETYIVYNIHKITFLIDISKSV